MAPVTVGRAGETCKYKREGRARTQTSRKSRIGLKSCGGAAIIELRDYGFDTRYRLKTLDVAGRHSILQLDRPLHRLFRHQEQHFANRLHDHHGRFLRVAIDALAFQMPG
jgi:hypothetical protein